METTSTILSAYIEENIIHNLGGISTERKKIIKPIIDFIQERVDNNSIISLNYICTHNSRRSQFSQVWSHIASYYYDIPNVFSYSGGVEVTAFNERAVNTLLEIGVQVEVKEETQTNPLYILHFDQKTPPLKTFSKLYDDASNAEKDFAAIMTCDHADQNCPFIPNASARLPLRFEDPKAFDDTPQEGLKYAERCQDIAIELFYIFSQIKK